MKFKHIRNRRGFTLVELIGAIVIILILVSVILVVTGSSRQRAMSTRVQADLEALKTAKTQWVLDNPNGNWPSDEPSRFNDLTNYLDPGQALGGLPSFEAPGETYLINGLGIAPTATP